MMHTFHASMSPKSLALTCICQCVLWINKDTGHLRQASIIMCHTSWKLHSSETSMTFNKSSKKESIIFSESKQMPDSRPHWEQFAFGFGPALFSSFAMECLLIGLKEEFSKMFLFISHGLGGIKVLTPRAVNCKHVLIVDTITLQVTKSVVISSILWHLEGDSLPRLRLRLHLYPIPTLTAIPMGWS